MAQVAVLVLLSTLATPDPAEVSATLRVASVQMEVSANLGQNLDRILKGIEDAAAAGASVAVFPETCLSGFASETIASLDWKALSNAMGRIAEVAKQKHLYVLYGCATPSGKEKPYNSAIVLGPDGDEITRYHKMFPESWFEPGDHLALFEIAGIPSTLIVCHDERFPELMRIPVVAGARIAFYSSYEINDRDTALRKAEGYRAQLIARAVENNIWIVQSNGVGPLQCSDRVSLGQSHIVAPDGTVVCEAPPMEEAMLLYDIRPNEATRKNALETRRNPILEQWYRAAQALIQPRPSIPEAVLRCAKLRMALMQGVPVKWDLEKNFAAFLARLAETRDRHIDMFVTPECWLDGYAAADKNSSPERLRTIAQDPKTSPFIDRVAREARERHMYICFGFTSLEEGAVFNAAGLWNDRGECLGVYHKTHLQDHDLQFAPGQSLPVFQTPWGPLGIMICADRRWPETARTLRLQGARLILNPSYGMHHKENEWWMRTRGFENQCFIAFVHPNVGFVVNPKGKITAKRDEDPGVLICSIDVTEAKDDNHLRDRRPDLYLPITSPAGQK